ncbi:alpha/beta hydrolase [Pediococcus pentosaceus]|jgi:predicted esterase|uniref:alpha/beta hydrolase n=1 Tax=Pediococcus pentosaceus TaxID=1255 RepID=UPI002F264DC3
MQSKEFIFDKVAKAGLTVYLHEDLPEFKRVEKRPFVMVIPGGGYSFCSEREAEPIALSFLAQGFHAGILRYHVGEHRSFRKSLEDGQKALRQIRSMAKEWKIDTEKIVVIGFSAGGHLAAALSTMSDERPNYCVLGYPAILKSFADVMQVDAPSLNEEVDINTPPTFLFSTFEDNVVPVENTMLYGQALEAYEVPFECHIFEKGMHGLSLATKWFGNKEDMIDSHFGHWFGLCNEWLQKNWDTTIQPPIEIKKLTVLTCPLKKLIKVDLNRRFLWNEFPKWKDPSYFKIFRNLTLQQLAKVIPLVFTEEKIQKLASNLTLNGLI